MDQNTHADGLEMIAL